MKRLIVLLLAFMCIIGGNLHAQDVVTDAPDEKTEDVATEDKADEKTEDVATEDKVDEKTEDVATEDKADEKTKDVAVTEEREVVATTGTMFYGKRNYTSADVKFAIQAKDEGAGVKTVFYILDNGGMVKYETPIAVDKEGAHSLSYRVEDNVGNMSAFKSFDFFVDASMPVPGMSWEKRAFIKDGVNYVSKSYTLNLYAFDSYSGLKSISYKIDGGEEVIFSKAFVINLEPGEHKIEYMAEDNVGNKSEWKSYSFTVDGVGPTVEVAVSPDAFEKDGKKYLAADALFSFTTTDAGVGVDKVLYSVDGGEWMKYNVPFKLEGGEHVVKVKSVDLVGNESNESDEVTATYVVDATVPEGELDPKKDK